MNEVLWWVSRSTGIVAFVLLTLALLLGILSRSGRDVAGVGRYGLLELHHTAALTALGLLAVHVVTVVLDSVAGVSTLAALVPFTSGYAPVWVGLGVLATYGVLVGSATGLLRGRLSPRGFAVVHALTLLAWPLAALHFLGAGTDGRAPWALGLVAACTALLVVALGWRLTPGVRSRGHRRIPRRPGRSGAAARGPVPVAVRPLRRTPGGVPR
ncbi:ferric reductase-like transmembrane domain-containing protein [Nocardioides sp. GCM10027113]|uniref:ferric reductase-like transmembrane domain-containing protein n=1 Tax=unclassified Nocardioides TaxID=2615069 RepID=UPI003609A69C